MADCTTHWTVCVLVVYAMDTHTYTSSDLAHLSSLYSGRTVLRKEKGVPVCPVSSVSLPVPPA